MQIKTALTIALLWMVALLVVTTQAQTVLEYWHSHDTTEALVQTFADEFNASQSDYKVVPRMTGNYQESAIKLVAALGSNSAPVLFDAEVTVFSKLLAEGSLADLSLLTVTVPNELIEDIYTVFWQFGETREGRYGLPWTLSVPVLYYNKSVFDQLGASPPTTWEEFEAVADKLTTRNTRGYIDVAGAFIFETMVTTRGGQLLTEDSKPNFTSPEAIEALTQMQRMAKVRTSIPRGFGELDQALVDFARTKGLMAIASEAFFPQGERFAVAFDVAAAPVPSSASRAVPLVGSQLVVLKNASEAQKQGAIAFWQYLMEPENIRRWVEASYFLPTRRSAVALLEPWYQEDPSRRSGLEELEYAIGKPKVAGYAVWQSYLAEAIERATKTGADPATVLQEAQQRALESP